MHQEDLAALQQAAAGLLYPSESDEPIEAVHVKASGEPPSPPEICAALAEAADCTPAESSLDAFFRSVTAEEDWHGDAERETVRRFRGLRRALEERLGHCRVFRVGEVNAQVLVVGKTQDQHWLGLKTRVVET